MSRKLAWVVALAGGVLLLALAFCGVVLALGGEGVIPWRGELPLGPKYKVAVLGDAQKGLQNLGNLLRKAKEENVRFILQTGDLVSTNDKGHYRLAALAIERSGLHVPFLVAPGNHDVKDGTGRFAAQLRDDRGPYIDDLRGLDRRYEAGDVVYFILDNADGTPPAPRLLERCVADARKAVVLAMHVPPFDAKGDVYPGYEPFLAWLEKSGVKYLLCGHVHGYFKKKVGQTTVVVNGVGGDYDKWQLDQKVYATVLDVDGTVITDRAIELPPEHGVWENVEHLAIGHVAEAYRRRPVFCWGGTCLLAIFVGFAAGFLRKGSVWQK